MTYFLARFTVHLDGYHLLVNKTSHNRLGDEVKQLPSISQETPVGCVPNFSPICVVGSSEMSNHIIYTASEFEKMQVLKIKVSTASFIHIYTYSYHSAGLDENYQVQLSRFLLMVIEAISEFLRQNL